MSTAWTDDDHQILLTWRSTRSWREIATYLKRTYHQCYIRHRRLERFYAAHGRYPTAAELRRRLWTAEEDEMLRQALAAGLRADQPGPWGGYIYPVAVRLAPVLHRSVNAVVQRLTFLDFDAEELVD